MAWQPDRELLVRADFPGWFVRSKMRATVGFDTFLGDFGLDWRESQELVVEDLVHYGHGLLLDRTFADGGRVLIWQEAEAQPWRAAPRLVQHARPENRWRRAARVSWDGLMPTMPPPREMQRAWQRRDADYDGLFFLAVRTTGVYCRPHCPARSPLPRNVSYFATPAEAEAAGFRACKRCHPADADDRPAWARRLMKAVAKEPERGWDGKSLRRLGIGEGTARRWFRKRFGVTFAAWARARRLEAGRAALAEGRRVDDAVLDSGFASHSGFRDAFARAFGAPPARARGGDRIVFDCLPSPLGALVVAASEDGVCLLEFGSPARLRGQVEALQRRFDLPAMPGRNAVLRALDRELREYFAGKRREFTVPLLCSGTPFQERVWSALRRIPYGATRSYAEIAAEIGAPGAQRAVGTANGRNRIAIVIPCHRVINAGGGLGGYGGGLHRKRWLLDLERRTLGG